MRSSAFLLLGLLLVGFPAIPGAGQTGNTKKPSSTSKALHDLFEAEWDYSMHEDPEWASEMGDRRWNDHWTDHSLQAIDRRYRHNLEVMGNLAKINRSALSPADQLNYDLFKEQQERKAESYKLRRFLIPLNQREGIQSLDDLADALRFETVKDYED